MHSAVAYDRIFFQDTGAQHPLWLYMIITQNNSGVVLYYRNDVDAGIFPLVAFCGCFCFVFCVLFWMNLDMAPGGGIPYR
jgi:hypothetical protein